MSRKDAIMWLLKIFCDMRDERDRYREALEMYANPDFYYACAFHFDRPTGGFDEDFEYNKEYGRPMPGKRAREALKNK